MQRLHKIAVSLVFAALLPAIAFAHPMGNFSINHFTKLRVQEHDVRVDYVLDFAEIPTVQLFPETRTGAVNASTHAQAEAWAKALRLEIDGRALPLRVETSEFKIFAGAGGLSTVRLEMTLRAEGGATTGKLHFTDTNFPARIGWKEIVIEGDHTRGFPNGNPYATNRSASLTAYPQDPASSSPTVVEARIQVTPASPLITQTSTSANAASAPAATASSMERLSEILGGEALPLRLVLIGMAIAFALGALHALSPGHGKTVVASFLVGTRGTAKHAVFLGAVVTFTHTAGVFLLGFVVLFLSRYVVPERLYPWIAFFSGLTILAVGVNLFRQRLGHLTHDHGPDGHSHDIPEGVDFRSLLALGFSGGIVPCPSALVVLLSAMAVHRVGAGLLFITAFSAGLASVLVAIGLLVVRAGHFLSRFDSNNRAVRIVPVLSALIVSTIGLVMAGQAFTEIPAGALVLSGQAMAVLSLGLFLGFKHATDADHVVAVTTFVSQESSLLRSCWIGAFWGLGHTLSLALAGILVIGLRVNIPDWIAERLEFGVCVMLVGLGANVLVRTLRSKPQLHSHEHFHQPEVENTAHNHWHVHLWGGAHSHAGWTHAGLRPLLTGMVHGAAGSAALMLLVLSTIRSPLEAFLYILIFGLGSILGMLAISFLLAVPLHWAKGRLSASLRPVQLLAGAFSCVFGVYLGAGIWMSLH